MQFDCGSLRFRLPNEPLKKGFVVLGHAHNFGHPSIVLAGSFKISKLKGIERDATGQLIKAVEDVSIVVRSTDEKPFVWIEKGTWHQLESLEDGSRYICAYPHRFEQAHTLGGNPGQQDAVPTHKRDADGNLWAYVDESIVEVTNNWSPAYE